MEIELKKIKPNKYNPREIFRGAAMEELKASMKDGGLIQPILVRPLKDGDYEVVAGMRRYYAAEELGWNTIECHIRKLSNFEAMLLAYSENVLRENLTPMELGRMYSNIHTLLKENKLQNLTFLNFGEDFKQLNLDKKMESIAKKSNVQVWRYISLLKLPKDLQNIIDQYHGDSSKGFPVSYGFELARLPENEIMNFYNTYNPKDYSIEQYKKKVSDKLETNKLEGEKRRKQLEGRINKIQLEVDKLRQDRESFEERINKRLEKIEGQKTIDKAIEHLEKQIEEFQSQEKLDNLAKNIKRKEHEINDLDILLERTEKEHISICPYCLAGIDLRIINQRKDMFKNELQELNNELRKANATAENSRKLWKELKDNNELLIETQSKIIQKEKELEALKNEFDE